MCTGWDVEQVKSIVDETLHDIVDPLVFAEAADLIADHKLCGHDVVVVSASGEEIVAPIARALGATHAMATRMVVEDGQYTGEIAFYCYGEGKAHAIRELAAREGYPLAHCYAYSDSITDLPMLEAVGHPTVVNPDRALRKEAASRGWPVLTFSKPGVAAGPDSGAVRRRDRHDRRGGRQRAGGRRGHLFAAAPLRLWCWPGDSRKRRFHCRGTIRLRYSQNSALLCDGGQVVQRNHGSPVRPRSIRKRRFDLPNRAPSTDARHPRGVIAAIMAEVLRACVIAKSGRCRRPFGWGCSRKHRKIAEANPRSPEMHAW